MHELTKNLWAKQDQHKGDRYRLFTAVAGLVDAKQALYPGSYVDIAPSFVWPSVTYIDTDKRADRFFGDVDGVREIIASHDPPTAEPEVRFIPAGYSDQLELNDETFDLLVSLYAGLISEHCTRYLRVGGTLLVNPSHGDTAMASMDPRYTLTGAIIKHNDTYQIRTSELDTYLIAKKPTTLSPEKIRTQGRGIAYTKPAFAYLFQRSS